MKVDLPRFQSNVRAAQSLYVTLGTEEQTALLRDFDALPKGDRSAALDWLKANGFRALYQSAALGEPVNLDRFKSNVEVAKQTFGGLDSTERRHLADDFQRLGPNDRSRALDWLKAMGLPHLYQEVNAGAPMNLERFAANVQVADTHNVMDPTERRHLAEDFAKLSGPEQSQALDWLKFRGSDALYQDVAPLAREMSLSRFEANTVVASRTQVTLTGAEQEQLLGDYRRLTASDRPKALDWLTLNAYFSLYQAAYASEG